MAGVAARPHARSRSTRRSRAGDTPYGTPDEVEVAIRKYADAGVDQVVFGLLSSTMERDLAFETIETFGKHVLPAFDTDPVHRTTRQREALRSVIGSGFFAPARVRRFEEPARVLEVAWPFLEGFEVPFGTRNREEVASVHVEGDREFASGVGDGVNHVVAEHEHVPAGSSRPPAGSSHVLARR